MRLIDADKLFNYGEFKLTDAVKYGNESVEQRSYSYGTLMMYEIADEIDDAPTVDPAMHGEWIEQEDRWPPGQYQCSVCHIGNNINTVKPSEFRYCWYCGAKMGKSEAASGVQDL